MRPLSSQVYGTHTQHSREGVTIKGFYRLQIEIGGKDSLVHLVQKNKNSNDEAGSSQCYYITLLIVHRLQNISENNASAYYA